METKAVTFRIEKDRWERLVRCAQVLGVGQVMLAKAGIDMACQRVERTGKLEISSSTTTPRTKKT
jgi:hypothetical protein